MPERAAARGRGDGRSPHLLLIIVACSLALGACSKCDVPPPFWRHDAPPAPSSCHDAPEAK